MNFRSVNEVNKLGFDDCQIAKTTYGKNIVLELEALIIKANNSQNSNYTDSYSDTTVMTLTNCEIVSIKKEGYREYDALDRIVNTVEDELLPVESYAEFFKSVKDVYLFEMTKEAEEYMLRIEFPGTDEINPCTDTYEVMLKADEVIAEWDRYLNRVQN